jgi:hypothetical protein
MKMYINYKIWGISFQNLTVPKTDDKCTTGFLATTGQLPCYGNASLGAIPLHFNQVHDFKKYFSRTILILSI